MWESALKMNGFDMALPYANTRFAGIIGNARHEVQKKQLAVKNGPFSGRIQPNQAL
jgi:hypothetical protein